MTPTAIDRAGFADPVLEAQAAFRALLAAMASPGSLRTVSHAPEAPPLDPATAAVLLTLTDTDTTLWLDDALAPAWDWLVFHAGVVRADVPEAADFVCATALPPLDTLRAGTDAEPERGATVVLQLPALRGGPAHRLAGPGIAGTATLAAPLGAGFATAWAGNHALFPRGIDLVLCAGDALCALPRSTRLLGPRLMAPG